MPLGTATITYDLADMLGVDFDARRTKVWVTTNVPSETVVDTDANKIRLGSGNGTIADDGTGSVDVWTPGTGSNPASWQTYIHVAYPDRNTPRGRAQRTFGPFTITASDDLADLIDEQEIPPTYPTEVGTALGGFVSSAQAAATTAAASATSAAASAAAAATITGLTGEDAAVTFLASDPTSAFGTKLASTYAADQVDFVDLVHAHSRRYTDRKFVKVAADKYQVRYHDGEKGVTYQFIKDTNDDFIKLDACYTGFGYTTVGFGSIASPGDTTGVWNTSSSSYYTTEVGATYTETIPGGKKVEVRIIRAINGGLWNVSVDGGAAIPVSCWAATTSAAMLVTLGTNYADTPHTVVWTFMGNDPANPPTGTARGYVRKDDAAGTVVGSNPDAITTLMVLADGSNKEFAFSTTKSGSTNWLPEHETIGSAFKIADPVFYIDGAPINATGMAVGAYVPVTSSFTLIQRFNGKVGATNVAEFRTYHSIDRDGLLKFDGRFKALTSIDQITGYCLMLPASQTFANEFITGILNTQTNTLDEIEHSFTAERDNVFSGAVISATNRNIIGAGTITNPKLTYRRGKPHKPAPGNDLFVWHRATKPKMYWKPFLTHPMAVDDAYAWSFKLMVGDIDNVYGMVKSA